MHDPHPLPAVSELLRPGVDDALSVAVVRHGAGAGLPVVALHGLPGDATSTFSDVARDLEHHHRVIAPDLLGLGRSSRPADVSVPAQAAAVGLLLDRLGADRVALLSHGLGGLVATLVAAEEPRRVAALVLSGCDPHADAWPPPPLVPLLLPGLGRLVATALHARPDLARRALVAASGGPGALSERQLDHLERELSAPGAWRSLRDVVRAVDPVRAETAWRRLCVRPDPAPVLVLWGAQDQVLSPASGRRTAAEHGDAVFVDVQDAGHGLPWQRSERVAEEVRGFLAERVPA